MRPAFMCFRWSLAMAKLDKKCWIEWFRASLTLVRMLHRANSNYVYGFSIFDSFGNLLRRNDS